MGAERLLGIPGYPRATACVRRVPPMSGVCMDSEVSVRSSRRLSDWGSG